MKRETLQKAYGELQSAIQEARKKNQKRIKLSMEAAKVLDEYIFDPECAFDEFENGEDT